jgi:lipopolysaccharide transport system permease protein
MPQEPDSQVETVIEATKGWRFLSWRELHAYRDLLWLLVWRDIASRYKQTVLGPLWYVVQPLATTLVFMVIFSRVARIPTNGVPSSLFYMSGLLAWNYFSQAFQSTAGALVSNSSLFGKVYFPRLIVPLSSVISNLSMVVVQLAIFLGLYLVEKVGHGHAPFGMTASIWLLPLVFVQVGVFSLGIGLTLAALTAKFRDFAVLAGFIIQLWMYATPVIYPMSRVPARWYIVVALNPMAFPLEALRQMLLGAGTPTIGLAVISIGMTLATLAFGLVVFQKVEKNFVDVI